MHIKLHNVSVHFPVRDLSYKSLKRDMFNRIARSFHNQSNKIVNDRNKVLVKSLSDINLAIGDGDRVGFLGLNGSGKTTLLRVISQVLPPISGVVQIDGSISNLIDITSGLDLGMSGRENVILKGMYMGISPKDMEKNIPNIEHFCDFGPFFDMPLNTYSSGMMVRLAFAIVTSVKFDILVLDEWLSVGDLSFLEKAEKRLDGYVKSASILIVASHSIKLIKQWCNRAIVLDQGKVAFDGSTESAVEFYQNLATSKKHPK